MNRVCISERSAFISSLLMTLVAGCLLGVFVWKSFFDHVPRLYPLGFEKSSWMLPSEPGPQAYFRKEWILSGGVRNAWIKVAAPDSFILYINGRKIAARELPMRNASGVFDIGPWLRPGKNVVGVETRRVTHPGSAKAIVEGACADFLGGKHPLFSDGSWKTVSCESYQGYGKVPWYKPRYNDRKWHEVRLEAKSQTVEACLADIHPGLFTTPVRGNWIGHRNPKLRSVVFERKFELRSRVRGGWIRAASDGSGVVTVNGVALTVREAGKKSIAIHNIGPFLKKGTNIVRVSVAAGTSPAPRLLFDIMATGSGGLETVVVSDGSWRVRPPAAGQWESAVRLAEFAPMTDSLSKQPATLSPPAIHNLGRIVKKWGCILFVLAATLAAWFGQSALIVRIGKNVSRRDALLADAMLHMPLVLALSFIYILQYDIRFDTAFPFQPVIVCLALPILFLFRGVLLLEMRAVKKKGLEKPESPEPGGPEKQSPLRRRLAVGVCLAIIVIVAATLRVTKMENVSLSHDELSMVTFSREILKRGYPVKPIGPVEKAMTTYEVLPYPIALSAGILGESDFAFRLPAVVIGLLTLLMVFFIASHLWGAWTGVMAAAIYALCPFAILWGHNSFHPQQAQFFTLLTSYFIFRSFNTEDDRISSKHLYIASVCFIFTYLSWEGTGVLLPAFTIYLLTKGDRFLAWLKSGHLWIVFVIVCMTVFLQMSRRIISNILYVVVGKGLAGATFKLTFLDPLYNPLFYIENFLMAGTFSVVTGLAVLGFPLVFVDRGIRYYFTVTAGLLLVMTNLMPNVSTRYTYFFATFVILLAAGVLAHFISFLRELAERKPLKTVKAAKNVFVAGIVVSVLLLINTETMPLYRIGVSPKWATQMLPEVYTTVDYKSTGRFLREHATEDDVIIALMPHAVSYYSGLNVDYFIQSYTSRQIFYDVSEATPGYLDKYVGNPVIRNLRELRNVMARSRKVWIVAAPYGIFNATNDKPMMDHIHRHFDIVFETYRARVYLWNY